MMTHDALARDTLRLVMNKANAIMKESNPHYDGIDALPDDVMQRAISQEMKQLSQTLESLKGHPELEMYAKTIDKMTILSGYLPKMMTPDEVAEAVERILSAGNYASFGEKMKAVMAQLRGKADNKVIKNAVEKYR